jgi:signal peptidase
LTTPLGQLWKNEYFQTAIMIILIFMVVFGFWFGLRLGLNTDYPLLAVASGSMSTVQPDDGWSHPFAQTLQTGDLIIVQGVRAQDIYAAPFNESGRSGDILVFRLSAGSEDLIVHRAVGVVVENGETEFVTKGDGNSVPGPGSPTPAQNVIGKVVFRIPWIGHLALFMHDSSGVYLVLALIIIIIVVELVLSIPGDKTTETKRDKTGDKTVET